MFHEKKCINCKERSLCRDNYASWIFFIIGLIAAVSIRMANFLNPLNAAYGKVAWYIGVSGFFLFFVYKFKINQARTKLINKNALLDKINSQRPLDESDYEIIGAILCGIRSNKEKLNYFFIFFISAVSLLAAIYIDFLR
ncbi:MAG: hypothetical protein ABH872_05800 [Candidatus Omnitrophota bacterium]